MKAYSFAELLALMNAETARTGELFETPEKKQEFFARIAERDEIVAYLKATAEAWNRQGDQMMAYQLTVDAEAIERGDHRKRGQS